MKLCPCGCVAMPHDSICRYCEADLAARARFAEGLCDALGIGDDDFVPLDETGGVFGTKGSSAPTRPRLVGDDAGDDAPDSRDAAE
jgi:hypothetical protein